VRLDLYLKKTGLVRQRSVAKEICDAGAASVNGRTAKPGQNLAPGDRIDLELEHRALALRVLDIPHGNLAKRDVPRYLEVVSDTEIDPVD
jgi:ribosomal 50S subunit-recycling heat shock protein